LENNAPNYQSIIKNASLGSLLTDCKGNILDINTALIKMLGLPDDSAGRPANVLEYKPLKDSGISDAFQKCIKGNDRNVSEHTYVSEQGQTAYLKLNIFPVWSDKQKMTGLWALVEDISKGEEIEELILEELKQTQKYLDTAQVMIVVVDTDEKVAMINKKACQILGTSEQSILGTNWFDQFIPERIREKSRVAFHKFVEGETGIVDYFERPVKNTRGEERVIAWNNAVLKDDAGNLAGAIGSGEDVTDRKKMESELSLRAQLLDLAMDSIYVIDTDGYIVFANEASWKSRGYISSEFTGANIRELVTPDYKALVAERIDKILNKGELTFETRHYRKDGSAMPVEVHARMISLDGRKFIISIARDMTERKLAEEVLKRSEERFRTILEDMDNGYFELDTAGQYVFVNDAMCKILGLGRDDIVGRQFGSFVDQSDEKFVDSSRAIMDEVISKGMTLAGLFGTIVKGDGSRRIIGISVSPLRDASGEIAGIRGISRDITDRMKMEQQLLMAGKLASIGELAAGVAHEINNPLTAIMGYAQLLADESDVPQNIKADLEKIYSQSQRAAKIVQNLLTFARSYALKKKVIDINELILRSLDLRSYEHKVGNIEIVTNLQTGLPGISADENQIQQVILNIIVNAEQALAKKHAGKIEVTTRLDNDNIRIIIADNGPGIPRDMLERLFDPFFTTKDVGEGTGLGLSVCHGIITKHGGRIYADSVEGQGSVFTIELPTTTEGRSQEGELPVKFGKGAQKAAIGKRVLIVDDEVVIRDILLRILTDRGYQVDSASSGSEGLEKIKGGKYDAYLLDIKMPGIDGKDMYESIGNKFPALVDRVIFITGDTITKSTLDFLESTGRKYLSKPLDFSRLIHSIEEVTIGN